MRMEGCQEKSKSQVLLSLSNKLPYNLLGFTIRVVLLMNTGRKKDCHYHCQLMQLVTVLLHYHYRWCQVQREDRERWDIKTFSSINHYGECGVSRHQDGWTTASAVCSASQRHGWMGIYWTCCCEGMSLNSWYGTDGCRIETILSAMGVLAGIGLRPKWDGTIQRRCGMRWNGWQDAANLPLEYKGT